MDRRRMLGVLVAGLGLAGLPAAGLAAKPPETWDHLVRVKSKRLPLVYLAPDADFRVYRKVMIDPTEVAFRKDWARDYNRNATALSSRVSDVEVQKTIDKAVKAASDIFVQAFTEGGYPVVTEPGPDVLRVKTGLIDLSVSAPDRPTMGRSTTFASEAGQATLVVEVRDSVTGAILGRALDRRLAGDTSSALRNSVTNRADFRILVKRWAKMSVAGLKELQALSPVKSQGESPK